MEIEKRLVVIGGGAAGVFAAIRAREIGLSVTLLERSSSLLHKVSLSGGGRCNLTNATSDLRLFVQSYPRGEQELFSSFSRFSSQDLMEWFETRGLSLKVESGGRVFPKSNRSKSVIDCLVRELERFSVDIRTQQKVISITPTKRGFAVALEKEEILECDFLLLATGSSSEGYRLAASLGHVIETPVPSLFSFAIDSFSLQELSGISIQDVLVSLTKTTFQEEGALLITHFGFSGPSILNLSSRAALFLYKNSYRSELVISWVGKMKREEILYHLQKQKRNNPLKRASADLLFSLPQRLWKKLLEGVSISSHCTWANLSEKSLLALVEKLKRDSYQIKNKHSGAEKIGSSEFVVCGGVCRKEIDFATFESRIHPRLYFAGEILDVDGVTGGFNLQHAWSSGWIAASAMAMIFQVLCVYLKFDFRLS